MRWRRVSKPRAGARAAHALDVAALRKVFALLLASLAAYMLYKSLGAG